MSPMMKRIKRLQDRRSKLATKYRLTDRTKSKVRKRLQLEINLIDAVVEDMDKFVNWQGKRREVGSHEPQKDAR